MRKNWIYWFLICLMSITTACNVCDNSGVPQDAILKEIYFNSKNLNNESMNILGINAEGTNLEEVLYNSMLFSPPSKNNFITYLDYYNSNRIYLYNLKKKSTRLAFEDKSSFFYNPKISDNGKYIVVNKNHVSLLIIKIDNDSIFNLVGEIHTINNEFFDFTISPNSQKLAYFTNLNDKIFLEIYDFTQTKVTFRYDLNQEINKIDESDKFIAFWSQDSDNIFYFIKEVDGSNNLIKIMLSKSQINNYNLNNIEINEICPIDLIINSESLNTFDIFISAKSGEISMLTLNDKEIINNRIIAEANQNEFCKNLNYNYNTKCMLYNKVNNLENIDNLGNLYIFDNNTTQNKYLFSNSGAGYWVDKE